MVDATDLENWALPEKFGKWQLSNSGKPKLTQRLGRSSATAWCHWLINRVNMAILSQARATNGSGRCRDSTGATLTIGHGGNVTQLQSG